jgi:hypothetical protein
MTLPGFVRAWLRPDLSAVFVGSLLLYGSVAWLLAKKGVSYVHLGASVIALAAAVVVALGLGWRGATGDVWSNFIKTGALMGQFAIPLGVAAATSRLVPLSRLSARLLVGVVVGLVVSVFMPLFWIGVVCSATGDCL